MTTPWDPEELTFNATKYGSGDVKTNHTFTDPSDILAGVNHEYVISFQHVPSQKNVFFKGFFTVFNETYMSDWASEQVFGRVDPIYMFKQNQRKISLAFKVPASAVGEAYENLGKVQKLTQFLYPSYVNVGGAQTITQSPLIRLKVMNLAAKPYAPSISPGTSPTTLTEIYKSNSAHPGYGLLGVITNLTFNHNLETDMGVIEHGPNSILPKMIEVNLDFSVIHEHPVGWQNGSDGNLEFSEPMFPYSAPLYEDPPPPPPVTSVAPITDAPTIFEEPGTAGAEPFDPAPGTLWENAQAEALSMTFAGRDYTSDFVSHRPGQYEAMSVVEAAYQGFAAGSALGPGLTAGGDVLGDLGMTATTTSGVTVIENL